MGNGNSDSPGGPGWTWSWLCGSVIVGCLLGLLEDARWRRELSPWLNPPWTLRRTVPWIKCEHLTMPAAWEPSVVSSTIQPSLGLHEAAPLPVPLCHLTPFLSSSLGRWTSALDLRPAPPPQDLCLSIFHPAWPFLDLPEPYVTVTSPGNLPLATAKVKPHHCGLLLQHDHHGEDSPGCYTVAGCYRMKKPSLATRTLAFVLPAHRTCVSGSPLALHTLCCLEKAMHRSDWQNLRRSQPSADGLDCHGTEAQYTSYNGTGQSLKNHPTPMSAMLPLRNSGLQAAQIGSHHAPEEKKLRKIEDSQGEGAPVIS